MPPAELIAIGGSEDKENDCTILREFIRLSGGNEARITVLTVATDKVKEAGEEYCEVLNRLGVKQVDVVDVSDRRDALDPERLATIEKATGIFFTGSDQLHITSLLGGSDLHRLLQQTAGRRAVIAGTSAGASMMGNSMILSGESDANPRIGGVELAPLWISLSGYSLTCIFRSAGTSAD